MYSRLDFLRTIFYKLGDKCFWLGASTDDGGNTWKTINGKNISDDAFNYTKPDGLPADKNKLYACPSLDGVMPEREFRFVCDKIR